MYCPKCGKENPEGARFCMHCGTNLEKAKVEISPKIEVSPEIKVSVPKNKSGINIEESVIQKSTIQQIETYMDRSITKIELKPSQMENLVAELKKISGDVNLVDYLEDIALRAEMDGDNEKAAKYWELRAYYLEKEAMEFYHKGDKESLRSAEKSLEFAKLSLEKASEDYHELRKRLKKPEEVTELLALSDKIRNIGDKIHKINLQIIEIKSDFYSAKIDENIEAFYGKGK